MRQKHSLFSRTAAWLIAKLNRFVEPVELEEPDKEVCSTPVRLELPEMIEPPVGEPPKEEPKKAAPSVEDMTLAEVMALVESNSTRLAYEDRNNIRAFFGSWQARHHANVQRMRSDYLMQRVEEEAAVKEKYRRDLEAKKEEILERLARYELDTGVPFFEWNCTTAIPQLAASEGKGVTPADVVAEMVEPDVDPDDKWRDISECPVKGNLDVRVEPVVVSMPTLEGKGKDVRTGELIVTLSYKGDVIIAGSFQESTQRFYMASMQGIESFLLRMVALPSILDGKAEDSDHIIWNTTLGTMRALLQRAGKDMPSFMHTMAHLLLLETRENQEKADLIRRVIQ